MGCFFDSKKKIIYDFTKPDKPIIKFTFFKNSTEFTVGKRNFKSPEYLNEPAIWKFRAEGDLSVGERITENIDWKSTIPLQDSPFFFMGYTKGESHFSDGRYKHLIQWGDWYHPTFTLDVLCTFNDLWSYIIGYELAILTSVSDERISWQELFAYDNIDRKLLEEEIKFGHFYE